MSSLNSQAAQQKGMQMFRLTNLEICSLPIHPWLSSQINHLLQSPAKVEKCSPGYTWIVTQDLRESQNHQGFTKKKCNLTMEINHPFLVNITIYSHKIRGFSIAILFPQNINITPEKWCSEESFWTGPLFRGELWNFRGIAPENSGGTVDGSEIRLYNQLIYGKIFPLFAGFHTC